MARKIGLLPGTFDPPHLGHIQLARAAILACELDEVWVLVNPQPEHKVAVLPHERRLDMVRLALAHEENIQLVPELFEHTMTGFGRLQQAHLEDDFVHIVGMDVIARLDAWQEYEEVVRRASFAVAHRLGSAVGEVDQLRYRLGALGDQLNVQLFEFEGYGGASSMKERVRIASGKPPEALAPAVYEYILANRLYR